MRTVIEFDLDELPELPREFENEIRFTENFVTHFLEKFTEEGGTVLDPFAGFGTSLSAAEAKNRVAYGVEYDKRKVDYIESQTESAEILHSSALDLDELNIPKFDLCITSPPFMAEQMESNPFRNYSGESSYEEYLEDIDEIFSKLESKAKDKSHLVVEVSNMKVTDQVTTLAWDIAEKINNSFEFKGEIIVVWKKNNKVSESYGFDHSYALIFQKM